MWSTVKLIFPLLSNLLIDKLPLKANNDDSTAPPRPHMPPQYCSSIQVNSPVFSGTGRFEFDLINKRMNQTIDSPWFGGYFLNNTVILLNDSAHSFMNGRCADINSTFGDPFGWLPVSKFSGTVKLGPEYHSRVCNLWNFSVPNISLSMCFEENNNTKPVLCVLDADGQGEIIYFGEDFTPIPPPAEDFIIPESCFAKPPVCEGGSIEEIDAFVFHPAHQFDLINEDVADILGDTVFICFDANNSALDHYAWVSRYSIQVWSGWGEYALCNRPQPNETGVCVGKEKFLVGREAAFGIKDHSGQCANNDDVGTWYSLPTAGLCTSDTQPLGPDASKGQCSWRVLKRLKTIDGMCLLKTNGMLSACAQQYDYPFAPSRAILLQSFASDDPSQGGCPQIA